MFPTTVDFFTATPTDRAAIARIYGIRTHYGTPRGHDETSRREADVECWRHQPLRRYTQGLPATPTHRARAHRGEPVPQTTEMYRVELRDVTGHRPTHRAVVTA